MTLSTYPLLTQEGNYQLAYDANKVNIPNHLQPIYKLYVDAKGVHAAETWLDNYFKKQVSVEQKPLIPTNSPVEAENAPKSPFISSKLSLDEERKEAVSKRVWRDDLEVEILNIVKAMFNPLYNTYKLFQLLYENAKRYAIKKGWSCNVTHVSFFCPIEIIAAALKVNRTTIWRSCRKLEDQGLIESRPHYTTVGYDSDGQAINRIDGTVWNIKMQDGVSDAKLHYEDLHSQYRDLKKDIESGETAFNLSQNKQMQQSDTSKEDMFDIDFVESFTLPPLHSENPVTYDCCMLDSPHDFELDTILDLPHIENEEARRDAVENAAKSVSAAINDPHSFKFFCKFLWCLIRHEEHGFSQGRNLFVSFYTEVRRVKSEVQEGAARKPGALLVGRLKRWGWWEQIMRDTPKTTVCRFMKI